MVENRRPRFFYGYVVALAASAIWMIAWGTFTTYGIFFKPLLTEFGWTRAMTSGPRSLAAGTMGLMGIVTGGLTDKFGPRVVILIFGCFLGTGYLLMSQISNIWQFYIAYGLIGIGLSAIAVPVMTTVARWFVKRRGLINGVVQSGAGAGGMIMSPLAGWLILTYGWRFAYSILGIIALVFLILPALLIKRDPSQISELPYGAEEKTGQRVEEQSLRLQTGEFSLRAATQTEQFWMLGIMLFSFGFCRSTTLTHIVAHVTDLGFSLTIGANILAVISGASIIGRIGMGRVADVIGNRNTFMIGYIVTAAVLLWVLIANELWMLYLFAAAFGFSWGTLAVLRMPILAEVFGLGSLGMILGTVEFGASIGAIISPLLAGWLFDLTGEYTVTFLVTAAVAVIGLILTILLKPIGSVRRGK